MSAKNMTPEQILRSVDSGSPVFITCAGIREQYIVKFVADHYVELEYLHKRGDFDCRIGFRSIQKVEIG